jgi:hypothetical protein
VKVGDPIVVESERALQPERRGVIEQVLQEQPPRFRVHWEDGRTTIFSPSGASPGSSHERRSPSRPKGLSKNPAR